VWLAVLVAAGYALLVLLNLSAMLGGIYQDSDAAAAPVLATLGPHAPAGSVITLGQHAWYEDYLLLVATRWLPLHRDLWELAPVAWCVAGLGLVGWSVARAFDRVWAAVVVAALMCVGQQGRHYFLSWDAHSITALHAAILGAVLVWLAPRAAAMRWPRLAVLTTVVGLFGALPWASDTLFALWALAPFVLAAALLAWCLPQRSGWPLLALAVASSILTVLLGSAVAEVMRSHHLIGYSLHYSFVGADGVGHNLAVLGESFASLAGGDFFGTVINRSAVPVAISGVLALGAAVAVAIAVRRQIGGLVAEAEGGAPAASTRLAYVSFWAGSLALGVLAYVATSVPVDVTTARYLLGPYVAVGALLPVLGQRSAAAQPGRQMPSAARRAAVTGGVALFALTGAFELARHPVEQSTAPNATAARAVAAFARAHGVARGYASYWAANDMMWANRLSFPVYPVHNCAPSAPRLCRDGIATISSWYTPQPGIRSMLVIAPGVAGLTTLDPMLGPPVLTSTVDGMMVRVYPYDIASRVFAR
jgi:hypothetical protein